jgi:hypothetical protein
MPKAKKPDLTLVVHTNAQGKRTWILDPQGRNTFRIVVVCIPEIQPGPVSSSSHLAGLVA